jgi:predicted O-methyltransferase YrrM
MCRAGTDCPAGNIIDIGPAQGGSSIAYAQGLTKSAKDPNWKVYSIEKGHTSNALATDKVANNEQVMRKNFDAYKVSGKINIIMAYSHEAFTAQTMPSTIGLLSIDADGALDRDFKIFYNHLRPNAVIVLDDYQNIINRHGQALIKGTRSEIEKFITDQSANSLHQLTPLGKEYATYLFVNYLQTAGLLQIDTIVGTNTVFAHKPADNPLFTSQHFDEMQTIRQEMVDYFWELHNVHHD